MHAVKAIGENSLEMQIELQTFLHQRGFMVVPVFSEGYDIMKKSLPHEEIAA